MWPRQRIDIGWTDLVSGAIGCRSSRFDQAAQAAEQAWSEDGSALACLSVRSGLDLLLTAADWPAGSEILMSAVNISGMVRVVEHHGLKIVAVDLDEDVGCRDDLLESLITPHTRAILVAQLLGVREDLSPIVKIARRHGLLVIEDCAQAFAGSEYRGHDAADVSLFSFGPIKTATALGGAMLRVRDPELRRRMRQIQRRYPVQSRMAFLRRLSFYSVLKFLGLRPVFRAFVAGCQWLGKDLDQTLNGSVRNFPGPDFLLSLRQQPSAALLQLMRRRFLTYPDERVARRSALGRLLMSRLVTGSAATSDQSIAIRCPGSQAPHHVFWLAMVQVERPQQVLLALRQHGFDATASGALRPVSRDRPDQVQAAARMFENVIYLPLYAELLEAEIHRMADCLLAAVACSQTKETPQAAPESHAETVS